MQSFHLRSTSALAVALALCGRALANDLIVLLGQSIQQAINSAQPGDRILVQQGNYFEHIQFAGKNLKVVGVAGALETILDGTGGTGPIVQFSAGQTSQAQLRASSCAAGPAPWARAASSPVRPTC